MAVTFEVSVELRFLVLAFTLLSCPPSSKPAAPRLMPSPPAPGAPPPAAVACKSLRSSPFSMACWSEFASAMFVTSGSNEFVCSVLKSSFKVSFDRRVISLPFSSSSVAAPPYGCFYDFTII